LITILYAAVDRTQNDTKDMKIMGNKKQLKFKTEQQITAAAPSTVKLPKSQFSTNKKSKNSQKNLI
jgi:hypothetical protein